MKNSYSFRQTCKVSSQPVEGQNADALHKLQKLLYTIFPQNENKSDLFLECAKNLR